MPTVTIMDSILPFKHPSDYILIKNYSGDLYRYPQYQELPDGFSEVINDHYGQPVMENGRLNPRWWAIVRYPRPVITTDIV